MASAGVQYLALLRGINVGGKNLVRMADLRETFEELGFDDVATYIASGNVLFGAPRQGRDDLAARIEDALSRRFGVELKVVLLTATQLTNVVEGAPRGFGAASDRCDVIFIRKPLTVKRAFSVLETREGVDRKWAGKGVVYFARDAARASGSRLSRVVALPEYQDMTIRSWSTTTKLLPLMDARGAKR
jgi:uncharacterized protein (DUF1697 family)